MSIDCNQKLNDKLEILKEELELLSFSIHLKELKDFDFFVILVSLAISVILLLLATIANGVSFKTGFFLLATTLPLFTKYWLIDKWLNPEMKEMKRKRVQLKEEIKMIKITPNFKRREKNKRIDQIQKNIARF